MFDIVNIGILVADVIVRTVDKVPERGKLGLVDSVQLYSGGNAMSASINLAKLGAKSAIIGKVGRDNFGAYLISELDKYNVDTRGIVADSGVSTSASVVLSDSGGERTFLHCANSNDAFTESDIDYSIVADSKLVFVAGTNLLKTFDGDQTAVALRKIKAMGKITALDVCWDDKGKWMEVLCPCLPYLDYFLPSYDEAKMLSGKSEPYDMAQVFLEAGVKHVVIKLGADGCYYRESLSHSGTIVPTFPGAPIDTTGAGDAFCSGFLYSIANSKSIHDACIFANAVGTLCVLSVGATSGTIPAQEVEKFIASN